MMLASAVLRKGNPAQARNRANGRGVRRAMRIDLMATIVVAALAQRLPDFVRSSIWDR
jgi:hypothetical protein